LSASDQIVSRQRCGQPHPIVGQACAFDRLRSTRRLIDYARAGKTGERVRKYSGRQEIRAALALSAIVIATSFLVFHNVPSSDLMAGYLAGVQFQAGNLDQIYTAGSTAFNLTVPDTWPGVAAHYGLGDLKLYPFIYPPLWAAVAAPITRILSPQTVFAIAGFLNPLMLILSSYLAWKIVRPSMQLLPWMGFGLAISLVTPIGFIALFQNQPQIFVSFLIILAIERSRANAPLTAGAAMALAASIKLYPAVFIVVWVARKEWRILGVFCATGALLGAASLVVAGAPLTAAFLGQIRAISDSVLVTQLNFNFASILGQVFLASDLRPTATGTLFEATFSGLFAAQPLWLGLISKFVMGAGLFGFWWKAKSATRDRLYGAIWPALLIFVSLASPLTWAYHYLSVVFLLPALFVRASSRRRVMLGVVGLIPLSLPALYWIAAIPSDLFLGQIIGTAALSGLALLFLWPHHQGPRQNPASGQS